jgi:hypothetical protein
MSRITEYVGPDGVESSELTHARLTRPRPGDLIEWPDGKRGRVWTVGTGLVDAGEVHVCNELGSAFLSRGSVSISGGPFTVLKLTELEPAMRCGVERFWNWGDRLAGADQGVDYYLARPIFKVNREQ